MKIAHVAYQTWPTQVGSVSRLNKILESQKLVGESVFIVSGPYQEGESDKPIENYCGDRYYRFLGGNKGFERKGGWLKRVKKFIDIFNYTLFLNKIIDAEKPDVIHAHATFVVGISSLVVGFFKKTPVVYEVRSTWEEDIVGGRGLWFQRKIVFFLEWLSIRMCDYPVFISKGLVEHYIGENKNQTVIYNCMSDPLVDQSPSNTKTTFGYLGTLAYYEGLEYLFHAASALKGKYDFCVKIAGSGEMQDKYIQIVKDLDIEDVVIFEGKIEPKKVCEFYKSVDVIVLPRRNLLITNRVSGLKPIEAFAYKKLVIAADVGGMRELFENGVHGLMFESESVDALVEKMEKFLCGHVDKNNIINSAYRHFLENFTSESMGRKYSKIYERLV